MKRKKKDSDFWKILDIILILAFLGLIVFLAFNVQQTQYPRVSPEIEDDLENELAGSCTLDISPNIITEGDLVTGTIVDGANTLCTLYGEMDGVWRLIGQATTDAMGRLTYTTNFWLIGTFNFRAICGDCITNLDTLVVNPLSGTDTDGDGIPDDVDTDDDNDGFSDQDEIDAGTDPLNPYDYPSEEQIAYTCGLNGQDENCVGTCPTSHPVCEGLYYSPGDYDFCACINTQLEEVHPDWKPDGLYHYEKEEAELPEGISYNCYDSDNHLGVIPAMKVKGYCTDDFGTHWDYCNGVMNVDWYCITDGGSFECTDATQRSCEAYFGTGTVCSDGSCVEPVDYYDVSGAKYWIHYDGLANGSPARMKGRFTSWSFEGSSSGTGSTTYSNIRVSFGGKQIIISTEGGTQFDYNLDSFMEQFDMQSGTIKFEELFANGYVRHHSLYSGTVDMS